MNVLLSVKTNENDWGFHLIKIKQKIDENKQTFAQYGDCLRACVASITNKQLEQVPHFCQFVYDGKSPRKYYVNGWNNLVEYFDKYNLRLLYTKKPIFTGNYCIGLGKNKYNIRVNHAVVCWQNSIIWNPSIITKVHFISNYINILNKDQYAKIISNR